MGLNPGLAAYMKNKQAAKRTVIQPQTMPVLPDMGKRHSKVVNTTKGKC